MNNNSSHNNYESSLVIHLLGGKRDGHGQVKTCG